MVRHEHPSRAAALIDEQVGDPERRRELRTRCLEHRRTIERDREGQAVGL
jgi:hypothetical protein